MWVKLFNLVFSPSSFTHLIVCNISNLAINFAANVFSTHLITFETLVEAKHSAVSGAGTFDFSILLAYNDTNALFGL